MSEIKYPSEMRKMIYLCLNDHGSRIDGRKTNDFQRAPLSPLIENVFDAARRERWSAEETMIALAYAALVRADVLYDRLSDIVNTKID